MLFRSLILRIGALGMVKGLVTKSKLFHPLVMRFVAGESLKEALHAAEDLASRGLRSSLDLLGENVDTREEASASTHAYLEIVERIAASPSRDLINISVKLTAMGLDLGEDVAEQNLRQLLAAAAKHDIFVRCDMEGSPYTERTIAMIEKVYPSHSNTGTVLQSMMRRTPGDVERLIQLGCRVRMVKGAYLEPPDVAFQDKAEVDRVYVEGCKALLKRGNYPAVATHDEAIIAEIKAWADAEGISKDSFEWQMLYGIRRDLQDALAREGYRVRVYIPYGEQWYPYFTRRLAERPANLVFIAKSLLRR